MARLWSRSLTLSGAVAFAVWCQAVGLCSHSTTDPPFHWVTATDSIHISCGNEDECRSNIAECSQSGHCFVSCSETISCPNTTTTTTITVTMVGPTTSGSEPSAAPSVAPSPSEHGQSWPTMVEAEHSPLFLVVIGGLALCICVWCRIFLFCLRLSRREAQEIRTKFDATISDIQRVRKESGQSALSNGYDSAEYQRARHFDHERKATETDGMAMAHSRPTPPESSELTHLSTSDRDDSWDGESRCTAATATTVMTATTMSVLSRMSTVSSILPASGLTDSERWNQQMHRLQRLHAAIFNARPPHTVPAAQSPSSEDTASSESESGTAAEERNTRKLEWRQNIEEYDDEHSFID